MTGRQQLGKSTNPLSAAAAAGAPRDKATHANPIDDLDFVKIDRAEPSSKIADSHYQGTHFAKIATQHRPVKHRPISRYLEIQSPGKINKGIHEIKKAVKASSNNNSLFFCKSVTNTPMPELEAACWGFYEYLVPENVPQSTAALYETKKNGMGVPCDVYVGVASKSMDNFVPAKDDPLNYHDIWGDDNSLKSCLANGVTIADLEYISSRAGSTASLKTRDSTDNTRTVKNIKITVGDILAYRNVKGLALGLTASYIEKEDDGHRSNISKNGLRVDFDASEFEILKDFKESSLLHSVTRHANLEAKFQFTSRDIRHFPNLVDAKPFYLASKPTDLPTTWASSVGQYIGAANSTNPWPAAESAKYQELEHHPVFTFFKYKTLLKYILTDPSTIQHIAELHIRRELTPNQCDPSGEMRKKYGDKTFINIFTEQASQRIDHIAKLLLSMDEFTQFINGEGQLAFNLIMDEIKARNTKFEVKIAKAQKIKSQTTNLRDLETIDFKILSYTHLLIDTDMFERKFKHLQKISRIPENTKNTINDLQSLMFAQAEVQLVDVKSPPKVTSTEKTSLNKRG